ncbi:MAG: MlaD family protein, partial [Rhodococcus sp. (in: high G+C Gram-positive bacteria)]|uniref:MCE family protein n=1 Tax=Rhodococcus sp. TaxID=1831 RepID=UPI003BB12335
GRPSTADSPAAERSPMTLTRRVRVQLAVFVVLACVGLVVTGFGYARIPQMLGVGTYPVSMELADSGGLYENANVSYRGTTIGRVSEVRMTATGARATLRLDRGIDVPADLDAEVRSQSAIGEKYVELTPRQSGGEMLTAGSGISLDRVRIPEEVGPVLDQVNATLGSIPRGALDTVLDESYTAVGGSGPDLRRLLDSTEVLLRDARDALDPTVVLVDQAVSFLAAQAASDDAIRSWSTDLATMTTQVRDSDAQLRSILRRGEPSAGEVSAMFADLAPVLPGLLPNTVGLEKLAATYNRSIEQILVLYPQLMRVTQSAAIPNQDNPMQNTYFNTELNDPPPCTTGFLPADQRRSPTELDVPETPRDLYCKLPQNDPNAVRGARNLPCIEFPGKRAPTVDLCREPEGYVPN